MESSTENIFTFESVLSRIAANRGRDDAFFVCTGPALSPRRTEIPRSEYAAIQAHKATCEKCSQIEKEKEQDRLLKNEGPQRVQGCLELIRKARLDVNYYQTLKAQLQEKKERGEQPPDGLEQEKLRIAEYDRNVALESIKREISELHKLLHHQNKIIREGARKEYDKYVDRMKQLKKNKKKER